MRRYWKGVALFYHRFTDDRCTTLAASLAYSSLLTLVPFLLVLATVASYLPYTQKVLPRLQGFIFKNFVAGAGDEVFGVVNHFLTHLTHLSWTTILSFVVASLFFMYNLVRAFNKVWHVRIHGNILVSLLFFILTLMIVPSLFASLIFIGSYVASFAVIQTSVSVPFLRLVPYLSAFLIFSFFNWVLPSCRVNLLKALLSGFVTMIFFELARYGFALYLSLFPTYQLIYGALATIPIFLVWIYLSWVIILSGAVLCKLLHTDK